MARGRKPKRADRPGLGRRIVRAAAIVVAAWLVASVAAVVSLRFVDPPFTAMMLGQDVPLRSLEHTWVAREAIAVAAAHAVIAAEDQRFLEHNGFDLAQVEKALRDYRAGDDLRGASTISQQVAKNLFLWPGRSFARKGIEAYFTLLIEACWPKERILEVYLNVAELGAGVFGVEAAARKFFGRPAAELRAEEAALLAAVLPSPTRLHADRPSDYVRERQAWVLGQIERLQADGRYAGLGW